MKHEILHPFGVRITEIDPARSTTEDVEEFATLLARHGVAVMPDHEIDGRFVTHVVTGLDGFEDVSAQHPLVRVHPISGRKALYLSAPARCVAVSGKTEAEAATLIRYLVEHSTRPETYSPLVVTG